MRNLNWEEVTDAGESTIMGAGAYALKIVDVKDDEKNEFLEIVYDIAEGDLKGKFATESDDWKHQFRQYYNDKSKNFFKRFLSELERDNLNFTIKAWQGTSDPKAFIGLNLGMLFRERRYLNRDGEAKWALDADRPLSLDDVREGKFTIREPRYVGTDEAEWSALRNAATIEASSDGSESKDSVYGEEIPF